MSCEDPPSPAERLPVASWNIIYNRHEKLDGDALQAHTGKTIPEITCVLSACHVRSLWICIAVGCRRHPTRQQNVYKDDAN